MKITASGGTDVAGIVLFWKDNLPADADSALRDNPVALIETLYEQGKLIRFPCDGDGGYTLAVFVLEDIPDELRSCCGDEEHIPILTVRGAGYFGGMEYMFKYDSSSLDRYPGMCEQVRIPDGTYSARVLCTDV